MRGTYCMWLCKSSFMLLSALSRFGEGKKASYHEVGNKKYYFISTAKLQNSTNYVSSEKCKNNYMEIESLTSNEKLT